MSIISWLVGRKAQILYSVLVLAFNITAIYYLFFFSNAPINLSAFFPNTALLTRAAEKPILAIIGKFKVTPSPRPIRPSNPRVQPSTIPSPTIATPEAQLINCVGPDGKLLFLTQQDCDNFNNAWKQATLSATPTTNPPATHSANIQ